MVTVAFLVLYEIYINSVHKSTKIGGTGWITLENYKYWRKHFQWNLLQWNLCKCVKVDSDKKKEIV